MLNRAILSPRVHAGVDNGSLPISITVPAGQVYRILSIDGNVDITAGLICTLTIDGKSMFWYPGVTAFGPMRWVNNERSGIDGFMRDWLHIPFMGIIADEGQTIGVNSGDGTGSFHMIYEIHGARDIHNRLSDGGVDGRKRQIISFGYQVTSVGAGLTSDIQIVTAVNAPGNTTFPYQTVVPPQRKYLIHGFVVPNTTVCGTNLALNGLRVVHEGRELISPAGTVVAPDRMIDVGFASAAKWVLFPEPYEVNAFEAVQVYMRVTSTDAGAQNATLSCGLLMTEEYL